MVNISHFDCDVLSSSLSPVSNMLALAYSVKYHTANGEHPDSYRGGVNQFKKNAAWCNGNIFVSFSFWEVSSRWVYSVQFWKSHKDGL